MKKLLLTLLITLTSLVSFAQESLFGKAYEFHFGKVSYNDEIEWIRKPTPVDIMVQFNNGEIIIFSEEHQVYQIIYIRKIWINKNNQLYYPLFFTWI
jgi:hypothetical protein